MEILREFNNTIMPAPPFWVGGANSASLADIAREKMVGQSLCTGIEKNILLISTIVKNLPSCFQSFKNEDQIQLLLLELFCLVQGDPVPSLHPDDGGAVLTVLTCLTCFYMCLGSHCNKRLHDIVICYVTFSNIQSII